jgi:hypothetical protein
MNGQHEGGEEFDVRDGTKKNGDNVFGVLNMGNVFFCLKYARNGTPDGMLEDR